MRSGAVRSMFVVLACGFVIFALSATYTISRLSDLTTQIQHQRRTACVDLNMRHDSTINELDKLLAVAIRHAKSSGERQRIVASRAGTVLLINALDPHRNCAAIT